MSPRATVLGPLVLILTGLVSQTLDAQVIGGSRRVVVRRLPASTFEAAAAVAADRPENANAPSPMLGSFYPTRSVIIGGSFPAGGGYSPNGAYGSNNSLSLIGPLSAFRATSAPITVYSRGYQGEVFETRARTFSTPNYPSASPVVYPTPNSYYFRPRGTTSPPGWPSTINWIDQN